MTYDILLSGATFSGTLLDKQMEFQNLIYSIDDYKSISGSYFVKFVVNGDGMTKEIENLLPGNTTDNKIISDYMAKLATENNWSPAVHRERRVPHRKIISIEIKKGKIKRFNL